jgi:hypothetical protein
VERGGALDRGNVSGNTVGMKTLLTDRSGKLPRGKLALVLSGIDVVLGR